MHLPPVYGVDCVNLRGVVGRISQCVRGLTRARSARAGGFSLKSLGLMSQPSRTPVILSILTRKTMGAGAPASSAMSDSTGVSSGKSESRRFIARVRSDAPVISS